MEDLDPGAPSEGDVAEETARDVANFGVGGAGDFPPGDPGLDLPETFAPATVEVSIAAIRAFLKQCRESDPRVTYGLGKKIKPGQEPGRGGFTQVDCSGFVREAMRRATNLGGSFPDGSVVQHDWVRKKGFSADTVEAASKRDGAVRIVFLSPNSTSSGIGHVALVHNGTTFESHGGVGPDSRTWTGEGWQGKTSVYVLTPAD